MSLVWDSQKVENTSTPRPAAIAAVSRTSRLLPMPGGPDTPTTHPCAADRPIQHAVDGVQFPLRGRPAVDSPLPAGPALAIASSRRAGTGSSAPLM